MHAAVARCYHRASTTLTTQASTSSLSHVAASAAAATTPRIHRPAAAAASRQQQHKQQVAPLAAAVGARFPFALQRQQQRSSRSISIAARAAGAAAAASPSSSSMAATAVLGTGCFWCTEACYKALKGVSGVTSGYAGGTVPNPTYEQVGITLFLYTPHPLVCACKRMRPKKLRATNHPQQHRSLRGCMVCGSPPDCQSLM
jgi:hypothetical protein